MTLVLNNYPNHNIFDLTDKSCRSYLSNQYYQQKIPRSLDIKISATNTTSLYHYLLNNYLNFQLEYSDSIKSFVHNQLRKQNQNQNQHDLNIKIKSVLKSNIDDAIIMSLITNTFFPQILNNHILKNHFETIIEEFKTCFDLKFDIRNISFEQFINDSKSNVMGIVYDQTDKYIGFIISTKNMNILVSTDYVIITTNPDISDNDIIFTSDIARFRYADNLCLIRYNDQNVVPAYAYGKNYNILISSSYDASNPRFKYVSKYLYKSTNTSKQLRNITYRSPSELYSKTWQNQNQYEEIHYSNSNVSNNIIQCMMTDQTGLRRRFVQSTNINSANSTNLANTTNTTKITADGETVFEKSNNKIITDTINNKKLLDDSTIGWKVCQNSSGDKRIVKLFIPSDAKKVIPIGDDFLASNFKERADSAIVMDIQEANLDKEISVVPTETEAFSYICSNRFVYKIGQQVIPDTFDPNPDSSCSNGIHYFRNRRAVFKTYINSYEDIEL